MYIYNSQQNWPLFITLVSVIGKLTILFPLGGPSLEHKWKNMICYLKTYFQIFVFKLLVLFVSIHPSSVPPYVHMCNKSIISWEKIILVACWKNRENSTRFWELDWTMEGICSILRLGESQGSGTNSNQDNQDP